MKLLKKMTDFLEAFADEVERYICASWSLFQELWAPGNRFITIYFGGTWLLAFVGGLIVISSDFHDDRWSVLPFVPVVAVPLGIFLYSVRRQMKRIRETK